MENKRNNIHDMMSNLSNEGSSIERDLKKKKAIMALGVVIILAVAIFSIVYLFINREAIQNEEIVSKQAIKESDASNERVRIAPSVVKLEKWEEYNSLSLTQDEAVEIAKNTGEGFINWNANFFPSEEKGFTSNPQEKYKESGIPNFEYTPITKESFIFRVSYITQVLLNPRFGNWIEEQHKDRQLSIQDALENNSQLSAIFTNRYKERLRNERVLKAMPLHWTDEIIASALSKANSIDENSPIVVGRVRKGEIKIEKEGQEKMTISMIVDYFSSQDNPILTKSVSIVTIIEDDEIKVDEVTYNDFEKN